MFKVSPALIFKAIPALVFAAAIFYIFKSRALRQQSPGMQDFFTDDDGLTWFTDDGSKLTPFDHAGREAVLAHIFRCPDGKNFVGYLEKYAPETKARLEGRDGSAGIKTANHGAANSLLVKKPHVGTWVGENSPAADAIRQVSCPNGGKDYIVVVPDGM